MDLHKLFWVYYNPVTWLQTVAEFDVRILRSSLKFSLQNEIWNK